MLSAGAVLPPDSLVRTKGTTGCLGSICTLRTHSDALDMWHMLSTDASGHTWSVPVVLIPCRVRG